MRAPRRPSPAPPSSSACSRRCCSCPLSRSPQHALSDATGSELHEVSTALERLREYYEFEQRGFVLRELAGGWSLASHPDAEPAARRLFARPRTPPLTPAQAETLAIVAYLQPVSRPEIARIRGVNAESAAGNAARARDHRGGRSLAVRGGPVSDDRSVPEAVRPRRDRRSCPTSASSTRRPSSRRSSGSGCSAPAMRAWVRSAWVRRQTPG